MFDMQYEYVELVLGKTLLQHLYGHDTLSLLETLANLTEIPSLFELFPNWSPEFCDFVAKCLHVNPAQRPTADELLQVSNYISALFSSNSND